MDRVAVLMTCFNRAEKTARCLKSLYASRGLEGFRLDVFLLDDGCTDSTVERVASEFPDVNILTGSGDMFWSAGMREIWRHAARLDYDWYCWLNDDVCLYENGLSTALGAAKGLNGQAVVCGTLLSSSGEITYGGRLHEKSDFVGASGQLEDCKLINGNVVVVSHEIHRRIGEIDACFTHAFGDYDYGLRALDAGYLVKVAPVPVGICEANPRLPLWCRTEVNILKRFRSLYSPLGYAQPLPYFRFHLRHSGFFTALKLVSLLHLRVVIPRLWLRR